MSADSYKDRLKVALWSWREGHNRKRRKDRGSGRADKRGARQEDAREIVDIAAPPQKPGGTP